MKEIKLTQEKVAFVDDEDYEYLSQWKWYALYNSKNYYAQRMIFINGFLSVIKMHRLIMNTPENMEVDHINHNGLDNRKINLRNCKPSENRKNRSAYGRSKYLGVTFNRKKYIIAQIKINGNVKYLGNYKTEAAAAKAYDKAAQIYHGDFANLNFKNQ